MGGKGGRVRGSDFYIATFRAGEATKSSHIEPIPYSGFFRGGKFSRIALIQLFEGEIFHESRQEHTVPNAFSKYFEGKIFTNGYRFMKFVKIFPLEENPLYGTIPQGQGGI